MSGVATAVVGGSLVSSYIGANASQNAANTEANAAEGATAAQLAMFNQEQANEKPYLNAGYDALNQIQSNMSSYNQPFTTDQFHIDPGYQFTLGQGEQAVQNSAAASGHLISSQELGNAAGYASNLADTTYNSAFNRYQTQIQNSYNRLASLAGLGQTGASSLNANATQVGSNIGNNIVGAGNASAAGQIGVANAITGGIGNATNGFMNYNLVKSLSPSSPGGGNFSMPENMPQLTMPQLGSSAGYPSGGGSLVSDFTGN